MSGTPIEFIRELVDLYGVPQAELVALTGHGVDPWLAGRPADVATATWFAETYDTLGRPAVHLRDLHYFAVAHLLARHDGGLYEGTGADWKLFTVASSKARELGLVSPFAFLDRRTKAEYEFDNARAREPVTIEPESLDLSLPDLDLPDWEIPDAPEIAVGPSYRSQQPLTVEVWIEKESAALEAEVLPVAQAHGVRVVVGVGYQSETAAANLVQRAITDGRDRVILWLADADSSGEGMAIATARHAEFLCRHWLAAHEPDRHVPRIFADRVALTLDQLAEIEQRIGRTIPVSPDVARDEGRVELQALAAFAPGWVGDELERRLQEITDTNLALKLVEWDETAEQAIEGAWHTETNTLRLRLVVLSRKRDAILAHFDTGGLKAALDTLDHEREDLLHTYQQLTHDFDPELPDPPEGTIDNLDTIRDWLLDTHRDYLDQLNAYRRHEPIHRRRPPLTLTPRTCAVCHRPLTGLKANARRHPDCRGRRRRRVA